MSPTERTLALLRRDNWLPAIVEHWNHRARVRQDLFGILDILALKDDQTLGIQVTSASNLSKRQHKIDAAEATPTLQAAGWRLQVHGWRPNKTVLVRELTPEGWITLDFPTVCRPRDPAPGAAPAPGPGGGGPPD